MTDRTVSCIVFALLWASVSACEDPGFERFAEVTNLRVLAIRVEPPELGPGDVATLDSLTVDPRGGAYRLHWEICLFNEGPDAAYACVTDPETGQELGFSLGESEVATLDYDLVTGFVGGVDALCASLSDAELPDFIEPPSCDRGFPVTVRLTAESGDGEGAEQVIAIKRVLLLREGIETTPNRNPRLLGLFADENPAAVGEVATLPPDVVEGLRPLPLRALPADDAAESYVRRDSNSDDEEVAQERLAIAWFSTHGRLERVTTYFSEGRASAAEVQTNELDLSKGNELGDDENVRVYAVLRDDRGGVDFAEVVLDRPR